MMHNIDNCVNHLMSMVLFVISVYHTVNTSHYKNIYM